MGGSSDFESPLEDSVHLKGPGAAAAESPASAPRPGLLAARSRRAKRLVDLAIASLLLLPALAFGLAIAVAIRVETRGPILFGQTRVGRGGRRFRLWKLRSMVANADEVLESHLKQHPEHSSEWRSTHKLKNDPRVTCVGRLLRRSSLDELPQLWNVLRGDMSMAGPRPIVEDEIPKYGAALNLYLQVRPGLTGLWQVSGRNDTSYRARVELDARYILDWTPCMEMVVLLRTVRVVLLGHGAY